MPSARSPHNGPFDADAAVELSDIAFPPPATAPLAIASSAELRNSADPDGIPAEDAVDIVVSPSSSAASTQAGTEATVFPPTEPTESAQARWASRPPPAPASPAHAPETPDGNEDTGLLGPGFVPSHARKRAQQRRRGGRRSLSSDSDRGGAAAVPAGCGEDDVVADLTGVRDGSGKPLDSPMAMAAAEGLMMRWSHGRPDTTIVVEHVMLAETATRIGGARIDHLSAVFSPCRMHVVCTPTPKHCRLAFEALTGSRVPDEGAVTANGTPLTSEVARRVIGAVPHFNVAQSDSTVVDNVSLAARMRLRGHYGVDSLVSDTLSLLGLGSFRHDAVGDASPLVQVLVNVAMELVANPVGVVLRDPCARLTAHEQVELADALARVAHSVDVPVVVVTTDTPYALIARVDGSLVAIGETGTPLYSGPVGRATEFLLEVARVAGAAGECPWSDGASSVDCDSRSESPLQTHMRSGSGGATAPPVEDGQGLGEAAGMQLACLLSDVLDSSRRHRTAATVATAFERHRSGIDLRAAVMRATDTGARSPPLHAVPSFVTGRRPGDTVDIDAVDGFGMRDARNRGVLGSWRGLVTCCANCSRHTLRSELVVFGVRAVALLQYGVLQPWRRLEQLVTWIALLGLFVLCALLASHQGVDPDGMMNKRGIVFFLMSLAMHMNGLFVRDDIAHRHAMLHLRQRGLYAPVVCWAATLLRLALPRTAIAACAYVAAREFFREALGLAVLIGLTSFAHSIGLALLLLVVPHARFATIALGLYYGVAVFLSGFIVTPSTAPRWLFSASLLRPGYGAGVAHAMRGHAMACDAPHANRTLSYCVSGDAYLATMGFDDDSSGVASLTLGLIATGLALLLLVGTLIH